MVDEKKNLHPARKPERVENAKPKRPESNDGYQSPFYIPEEEVPSGVDYRWVRYMIDNVEDQRNVDSALIDGWRPVDPDRHPNLTLSLKKDFKPEYIQRSGHILMERDAAIGLQRKEQLRKMNEEQVDSVKLYVDGADKDNFFTETNKVTRTRTFQ